MLRVYRSAIAQGVSDTIITPGLERPNWVDASTLGRLIGQFRSFTLSSTFKVGLRASQDVRAGNMAPIMAGTMFSLALGMLSYYTWAHTVGGRTKERMLNELDDALNGDEQAMARWADEAITRSGLLGVFAEAQKFAERTPGLAPYATFAGVPPARSPYLNPATELLGPWMSAVQNVGRIAVTADDPTSETFRAAKQLVPYQNVFYLRLDERNGDGRSGSTLPMTVSTTAAEAAFAGNGVTTVFPLGFEVVAATDLVLTLTTTTGAIETPVLNVDYTVSNLNNEAGATVTLTLPLATGEVLRQVECVRSAADELDLVTIGPRPFA